MNANWGVTNFKWQGPGWKIMPHVAFLLVGIMQCKTVLSLSVSFIILRRTLLQTWTLCWVTRFQDVFCNRSKADFYRNWSPDPRTLISPQCVPALQLGSYSKPQLTPSSQSAVRNREAQTVTCITMAQRRIRCLVTSSSGGVNTPSDMPFGWSNYFHGSGRNGGTYITRASAGPHQRHFTDLKH